MSADVSETKAQIPLMSWKTGDDVPPLASLFPSPLLNVTTSGCWSTTPTPILDGGAIASSILAALARFWSRWGKSCSVQCFNTDSEEGLTGLLVEQDARCVIQIVLGYLPPI